MAGQSTFLPCVCFLHSLHPISAQVLLTHSAKTRPVGDSAYGKCLRDFTSITNSCGRKELECGLPAVKVMCHFIGGYGGLLDTSRRHSISYDFFSAFSIRQAALVPQTSKTPKPIKQKPNLKLPKPTNQHTTSQNFCSFTLHDVFRSTLKSYLFSYC